MELTNQTLAIFLVTAIVVSVLGTIISSDELGVKLATGYVPYGNASAHVQVTTTTSISFVVSSLDWGTGSVNSTSSDQNCTLITNVTNNLTDCNGFNTGVNPLILQNDGNTNVSVVLRSNATAQQFIGADAVAGGPQFMWNISNNETGSCVTPNASLATFTSVSTTDTQICDVLDAIDTKDSMKINIKLNLPFTTPQGDKTAVLTATATGL